MTASGDGVSGAGTLRIGSIVVGADDVPRAVAFWTAALGYRPREEPEPGWAVLTAGIPGRPNVSIMRTDTPPQERPRLHLDLYAADQDGEVDRLLGLGATRVDWPLYPPDPDFVVLADTEGNVFCVIDANGPDPG